MSIRSQKKRLTLIFKKIIYTRFIITWNRVPRYRSINHLEKHSKTCLPNLSIHGLFDYFSSTISNCNSCLFYHYINCISTLLDHIVQQLISTISRSFENLLHKLPNLPIYELFHNLNRRYSILISQMVNFQRKVSTRISSRKINFHDIWKPVTIFTKSFNLRINLNRRYLIPQKR